MGIHRLREYIQDHYDDWQDTILKNHPIVLDGSGLPFYLAERVSLQWQYGGQYLELEDVYQRFFDTLIRQNVKPICVVLDGVSPIDKLDNLMGRKSFKLKSILKKLDNESFNDDGIDVHPPLVTETFRKFLKTYKTTTSTIEIYGGDEEADSLGVVIANKYKCPLLGNDSDYFISALNVGYIPYNKLSWTLPGEPITGQMYQRDLFARSLGIDSDMVLAIPAIVGNDSIPNLVEETALKYIVRGNSRYRGGDTKKGIDFIQKSGTMKQLESNLQCMDMELFKLNLKKARVMYEGDRPFDERGFLVTCSYKNKDGRQFPQWMVKQYREFDLSIKCFDILMNNTCIHRVVADDWCKDSCKMFSVSIRQVMYGIMQVQGQVCEVIREERELIQKQVDPTPSNELSIDEMPTVPEEVRVFKLCSVLRCDPDSLSGFDREWYIPIASVCYWANNRKEGIFDLDLKALLLCFAECFHGVKPDLLSQPAFNLRTLHILTQWQCVYHDSILLNQVLALPLPYLSPAQLFDGTRLSYYYQESELLFDERLSKLKNEIRALYKQLLEAVNKNLKTN